MTHIKTAVFPVAGLGSRFLPITKTVPKEMLPLIDRPLISYAVEEAKSAGIEQLIFVSSPDKPMIEQYFQTNVKLENHLFQNRKNSKLRQVQLATLPDPFYKFVYQTSPRGLGHAVWTAREYLRDEPFAVILADDFIHAKKPCLAQMIERHAFTGGNMVATMDVGPQEISAYGCLDYTEIEGNCLKASGMVEKPTPEAAPSTQAVIGRYILQPSVLDELGKTKPGAGGEIQLTDAIAADCKNQQLWGLQFEGQRYDCGSKIGYLDAIMALALERADTAVAFRKVLRRQTQQNQNSRVRAAIAFGAY